MSVEEKIQSMIDENDVILFMKGTPDFPQCGFSGRVADILRECDVKYVGINVLEDPDIRQGIKDFSKWPTIPQLYVKGEFIGGCDIVNEMYENGELESLLSS